MVESQRAELAEAVEAHRQLAEELAQACDCNLPLELILALALISPVSSPSSDLPPALTSPVVSP